MPGEVQLGLERGLRAREAGGQGKESVGQRKESGF